MPRSRGDRRGGERWTPSPRRGEGWGEGAPRWGSARTLETRVRLIGVDAPESVDPRQPVQRFAHEAAEFLDRLIGGKTVRLAYEPAGARLDRYGRTLAYLYLEPGGTFVNLQIIATAPGTPKPDTRSPT